MENALYKFSKLYYYFTKRFASIALMTCMLMLFISHVLSVQEWQKNLNQKLEPFLQEKELLKDDEVVQLGKKDPEAYPSIIYYYLRVKSTMTGNTMICESLHETPLKNKNKSNCTYTEKIDYHKKIPLAGCY